MSLNKLNKNYQYYISLSCGDYPLLDKKNNPLFSMKDAVREAYIQYGQGWKRVFNKKYETINKDFGKIHLSEVSEISEISEVSEVSRS